MNYRALIKIPVLSGINSGKHFKISNVSIDYKEKNQELILNKISGGGKKSIFAKIYNR